MYKVKLIVEHFVLCDVNTLQLIKRFNEKIYIAGN